MTLVLACRHRCLAGQAASANLSQSAEEGLYEHDCNAGVAL